MWAWHKSAKRSSDGGSETFVFLVTGFAVIIVGLVGASFGSAWSPQVYEYLFGFGIVESIDAFMPYFPLVPFYPIFVIMLGAFLIVKSRA